MRDGAEYFVRPKHPLQRRYEALRAYLVEEASAENVGRRFEYGARTVQELAGRLRRGELDPFFARGVPGPEPSPRPVALRDEVLALRRLDLDLYTIVDHLGKEGIRASHNTVWRILKEAGVPRLPKRRRAHRDLPPSLPPVVADAGHLDLSTGRAASCRAPLVFLFAPLLARLDLAGLVRDAGFPGSSMIPAAESLRSLLALKLLNRPRKNHVMGVADDEGYGLFAGLNVLPKTTALSAYSYRVGPAPIRRLLEGWAGRYADVDPFPSASFNFDFHTIRHYGDPERSRLEKNYVPRRSQSLPSVLCAFAQEHGSRTLVYAHANLVKDEKRDEVVAFAEYWKKVTGAWPKELVFDAQATTHQGLAKLDKLGITFLTLRERKPKEVARLGGVRASRWERVKLNAPDRKWRTPLTLDERVRIQDYPKRIRQVAYKDLGRDEPTLLLTNDHRRGPAKLFERYAQRTPIENSIGEQVGFFHVDALSSDVRLKVELDVVLSVVASNAYHWLAHRLKGYEAATAATLWRVFLDRPGHVRLTEKEAVLRVRRFSKAPVLLESSVWDDDTRVPWLGNRRVRLQLD